jgi:hypothetical protein
MLALLLFGALLASSQAAVTVPRWFGDNMVFQVNAEYGARSFLNGKARPSEKVRGSAGIGLLCKHLY